MKSTERQIDKVKLKNGILTEKISTFKSENSHLQERCEELKKSRQVEKITQLSEDQVQEPNKSD